jgi:hypothetical protein
MIIETDFLDHWKTRLIVRLLGTESAPLHIIRLWSHCQTRKTNRFPEWNPEILSAVCKWGGDANVFWSAILQTFGRIEDGCFVAHQWDEVNSSLIASWSNGGKGGRPKKPRDNPRVNPDSNPVIPQVTHGVTDREEKIEKTNSLEISSVSDPESDSLRSRINKWFRRREGTEWQASELKALRSVVKLNTPESDLQLLDARYELKNKYRRKDILTLLNNWNTEIDRCKSGDDDSQQQTLLIQPAQKKDVDWRDSI